MLSTVPYQLSVATTFQPAPLAFSATPAISGYSFGVLYRNVRLSPEMEEAAAKVQEEVSQAYEEAERALELMRTEGETEELTAE